MTFKLKPRPGAIGIVGACLLVLGLLLGFAVSPAPRTAIAVLLAIGVPLLVGDRLLMRRRKLIVDETGIVEHHVSSQTRIPWDRVAYYTYHSFVESGVGRLARLRAGTRILQAVREQQRGNAENASLLIVGLDGERIRLSGNRWVDNGPATDFAFDQLHAQLRPRARDYAPHALTDTVLSHEDRTVALADIERVEIADGALRVYAGGKRWSETSMADLHCPMLFAEELNTRGIRATISMRAPVPRMKRDAALPPQRAPIPPARTVQR